MGNDSKNYMYRMMFKLKLYQVYGDEFQRLFSDIMTHSGVGFQAVSPWGSWGDGGNDGWISAENHYFQVYGPKVTSSSTPLRASNKAIEDFEKLENTWGVVKKYSFVMNDKFMGVPAPIAQNLERLASAKNIDTNVIDCNALMSLFLQLSDELKQEVVGIIPSELPEFIDTRAVKELLTHLIDNSKMTDINFLHEIAPTFDDKIKFNGLSDAIGMQLRANSYHTHNVDAFLDSVDTNLKQMIAEEVNKIYQESKLELSDGIEDVADLRYLWMRDKLIPPQIHESKNQAAIGGYRRVAEIVLAKYFETCDAYENPNRLVTS